MRFFVNRCSWVAAVAGVVIYASSASAVPYSEQYNMTIAPNLAGGAVNGHLLSVATGTGTNGPSGSTFSGGIMTYLDDSNSSGNQGYYLNPADNLLIGSSNFLADFRIQILETPGPNASSADMSFKSGNGRGLRMETSGVTWVNGSGFVGTANGNDFTSFKEYRVIINGATNTADFYGNSTGTVNNAAAVGNYVNLASTSMGGSGFAGELGAIGFALGSLSGSGTTLANFKLDWFCVESGTSDVNSIWDGVGGAGNCRGVPEPATLALLVLGGVPMIRRRRAA